MASGDEKFSRVIDGLRPHTLQSSRLFRSFMMWNDGNDASTNNMRASNTPAKPRPSSMSLVREHVTRRWQHGSGEIPLSLVTIFMTSIAWMLPMMLVTVTRER